ncbi:hypothetical protein FBU30_011120 [Linnemannia zychae]|nr:hypothetical protein FBU30_011120 [Linnemannia zychae]
MDWAVLAEIFQERKGKTEVSWVPGHSGEEWNERADKAAKEHQRATTQAWKVDERAQTEIRYTVQMDNTTLEGDTRQALKQQTTRRWHQKWRALKRTKQCIPDYDGVDWLGTLAIWHDNKPVFTFYSSQQDTRLRAHRTKKIHGMLPTMNALHARRPDLYPNTLCKVCLREEEDNEHVWICEENRETMAEIMQDGYQRIDEWGMRATREYNRRREQKGKKNNKERAPAPAVWVRPSIGKCIRAITEVVEWPRRLGEIWGYPQAVAYRQKTRVSRKALDPTCSVRLRLDQIEIEGGKTLLIDEVPEFPDHYMFARSTKFQLKVSDVGRLLL